MLKGKDRRQSVRYKAGKLVVSVKPIDSDQRPDRVRAIDFNCNGLSFTTSAPHYAADQPIVLDIQLDDIQLHDIQAVIRHADNGRIGVQFDFSSPHMQSLHILDALERIEGLLHTSRAAIVPTGVRKMRKRDRYSDKH
ncbi:MAG: PilZ domain-containing protein [Pseudomonadota bacterium]